MWAGLAQMFYLAISADFSASTPPTPDLRTQYASTAPIAVKHGITCASAPDEDRTCAIAVKHEPPRETPSGLRTVTDGYGQLQTLRTDSVLARVSLAVNRGVTCTFHRGVTKNKREPIAGERTSAFAKAAT